MFGQERPELAWNPGGPYPFDHAYAVTCHKAQGSEWPSVLVLEQRLPFAGHEHHLHVVARADQADLRILPGMWTRFPVNCGTQVRQQPRVRR